MQDVNHKAVSVVNTIEHKFWIVLTDVMSRSSTCSRPRGAVGVVRHRDT